MNKNLQNPDDELRSIIDALADSVLKASDEEILEEIQQEGLDPKEVAGEVRKVLFDSMRNYQQRRLYEARKQYKHHVEVIRNKKYFLPSNSEDKRTLLNKVFALKRDMLLGLITAQYRDFTGLNDSDVDSLLKQFIELGLLENMPGNKENK